MLMERKLRKKNAIINKNNSTITGVNLTESQAKSTLVIDSHYVIKDTFEPKSNILINVGFGISYTAILGFLIFKLLG